MRLLAGVGGARGRNRSKSQFEAIVRSLTNDSNGDGGGNQSLSSVRGRLLPLHSHKSLGTRESKERNSWRALAEI